MVYEITLILKTNPPKTPLGVSRYGFSPDSPASSLVSLLRKLEYNS